MKEGAFCWQQTYDRMHQSFPGYTAQPVIGITGNFGEKGCELAEGYFKSVLQAGATPVIIPPFADKDALINVLDHVDGLLFSGGGDINPLYLNEEPIRELGSVNAERDLPELLLARLAYDRQIPMLGICRGIQILAAALGGSVHQDIYQACAPQQTLLKHSQNLDRSQASHFVHIEAGSLLHGIMQTEMLPVNSFHHQAVKEPGKRFTVCARSADGVIEAIESAEHKSILGVQWHPECFILKQNDCMMPLFEWLTREARSFSTAKQMHHRILTLDSHCDTPMFFEQNISFHKRDPKILVDLHKMNEGHLDATIMVAYLKQEERTEAGLAAATAKANLILDQIVDMATKNCTAVQIARTPEDLFRLKNQGKKAIMLGIENGYALGRDIRLVEHFKQRGVVYITLCHNGNNDICDSAKAPEEEHHGVSAFGEQVIQEMNRQGIMVDLSHASEKSFYDALEISRTPIVCSHSSCRSLCDVPRNLTDDQLRSIARKGGVVQVTLYNGFLKKEGQASILDAMEHLNHMIRIMGVDHVGIGTDFDGDGGIPGCASAAELINFTRRLIQDRYNEEDIRKIWGGNFLRVMEQVQNFK